MTVEDRSRVPAHPGSNSGVVSVTKYIPYPAVPHAGGQYVWRHTQALSRFTQVEYLAPDTPLNRDALPRAVGGAPATLLRGVGPAGTGRFKLLTDLESAWQGSAIAWPFRRLFQTGRAPWDELARADLIEFQWSEMMALAPLVRQRVPGIPLVGIGHDVITQRWERAAQSAENPIARAAFRLAASRSRAQESRSFSALDVLVVFSDKDAELARRLAPTTRVEVVHPGLGPTSPLAREPDPASPIVLFTGALDRPDNARGIGWFLEQMWPNVLREVPTARLVIAGANPPDSLTQAVANTERAELTGFVDSLDPWYARASVFVAPLRTGAGVKFKTIDAMLRQVPVVSTTVGAEGIEARSLFAAVTDDTTAFADAVVRQLVQPDDSLALEAQRWADGVYGVKAFEERLRSLYLELLPGA